MPNIFIDDVEVIVSDIDQYMQINDISGADLARIWPHIKELYDGYEKWICYRNYDSIPHALLKDLGGVLEDDCIETILTNTELSCLYEHSITQITEENLEAFTAYHDKCNPNNGAKSAIIRRNLSRWGIFAVIADGRVTDYTIISMGGEATAEIYCIEASDYDTCVSLVQYASKYAFDGGKKDVLYMASANTTAHKAVKQVGFVDTGVYMGYELRRSR